MMNIRRRLGQHFLRDPYYAELMSSTATAAKASDVLELGTGTGILTDALCKRCRFVTSYEKDEDLYEQARVALAGYKNLRLVHGDGFKDEGEYDGFVSSLPYSESRRFVSWSASKHFKVAVVVVQEEFAEKLLAPVGGAKYRAVSVIARSCFDISLLRTIPAQVFEPPPKVNSSLLLLLRRRTLSRKVGSWVFRLFGYRGKTVSSTLKHLRLDPSLAGNSLNSRIGWIDAEEMYKLAENIAKADPATQEPLDDESRNSGNNSPS